MLAPALPWTASWRRVRLLISLDGGYRHCGTLSKLPPLHHAHASIPLAPATCCRPQERYADAISHYQPLVVNAADDLLSLPAILLANLCVCFIMTSQVGRRLDARCGKGRGCAARWTLGCDDGSAVLLCRIAPQSLPRPCNSEF